MPLPVSGKTLLFLLALSAACAGCSGNGGGGGVSAAPSQDIEGLSMFEMNKGSGTWRLQAEKARVIEKEKKALLSLPVITFLKGGKELSRVNSQEGEIFMESHDVLLTGKVLVESFTDKSTLETERLNYTAATEKIWSVDPLLLKQPKTIVKGTGFTSNPDLSEIQITKQETRFLK